MKNYAIPTLLGLTILLAGVIGFSPVEEASAVHTTLQTTIGTLQSVEDTTGAYNQGDDLEISCTGAALVKGIAFELTGTGNLSNADQIDLTYDRDGGGNLAAFIIDADIFDGATPADTMNVLEIADPADSPMEFSLEANGSVALNFATEDTNADSIGAAKIRVWVFSAGTCTNTA